VQRLSPNARGSLYMVLGSLAYVLNDAAVRLASEEGLGVYQVIALRGASMMVLFAAVGRVRNELPRRLHLRPAVLGRVAAEVMGTVLFFTALVHMDFANAQAILQIVPLVVTLAAAVLLGERVSRRRYAAIIVGLIGVVIIVRPATDGFTPWSLVVVLSVLAVVARELMTRQISAAVPALSIALLTAGGNTAFAGSLARAEGWTAPSSRALGFVALASGLLFFGYLFTIQTVRVGDLSVSAPFRYTVLLGAIVSGSVFFNEPPDALTLIGATVILGTGLYAISLDRASSTDQPETQRIS